MEFGLVQVPVIYGVWVNISLSDNLTSYMKHGRYLLAYSLQKGQWPYVTNECVCSKKKKKKKFQETLGNFGQTFIQFVLFP